MAPHASGGAGLLRQSFQRLGLRTAAAPFSSLARRPLSLPFHRAAAPAASATSTAGTSIVAAAAAAARAPRTAFTSCALGPFALSPAGSRSFSVSAAAAGTWLEPRINRRTRMRKGRPRVATGGSVKGTTVVWGDYGLRMRDHHRRISAAQLKVAEDTIKQRLRGERYRLYKRVNCNIGVFVSGNEMRMGKGKGSFDHWAARVAVSRIIFELRGAVHEQVVRDAFRLAGNKLPGQYEFVRRDDPAVVGITKLRPGVTLEELQRPRRQVAPAAPSAASPAESSATSPQTTTGSAPPPPA